MNVTNNWGFTVLIEASRFVIKSGADVSMINIRGDSALYPAAMCDAVTDEGAAVNQAESVKLLLRSGAKVNIIHWRIQGDVMDARPPGGPNFFIFMQFSAKKLKNNGTFGSWRTPLGKSWIRHCNILGGLIDKAKQDCILVGCVPIMSPLVDCIPACTAQGVSTWRVSVQGGVCQGVSAQGVW